MTSAALAAIAHLTHSPTPSDQTPAARFIKNAVVGNPTNKRLYLTLGAVPPLLRLASHSHTHPYPASQSLAALGSLSAHLPASDVPALTTALLHALFSPHPPAVAAAVRALKLLVRAHAHLQPELRAAVAAPPVPARLVALLAHPDPALAAAVARVLSRVALAPAHARVYEHAAAVRALVALLRRSPHPRSVHACLDALAALARALPAVVHPLTARHNVVLLVLPYTRSTKHALRLAACRLLTIFHSAGRLRAGLDGAVTTALVGLVNSDDVSSQVSTSHTLAELLLGSEELQRIATETDVIEKLAPGIKCPPDPDDDLCMHTDARTSAHPSSAHVKEAAAPSATPKEHKAALQAAALTALAAVCSEFDEARERAIKLQLLPYVIGSLSGSYPDVVLGSLKCIRSLSRSVKIVRRDIANEHIGKLLLNLLSSESKEVARIASATLCNLVLDFSPVRVVVLEKGGTKTLVDLLKSDDEELRKNALWALKNLFFKADSETKSAVMATLGYDNLQSLCCDKHPRVRELAMTVVRNLACSGSAESQCKQLDALFAATGDRLITLLSKALRVDADNLEVAEQALYVVCNIASGTEEHKTLLMNSDIPQLILWWSSHENERARIAAIWCIINLAWKGRPVVSRRPSRLMRTSQLSGRNPRSRLEMLRRQHLPLPSSIIQRRQLENIEAAARLAGLRRDEPQNQDNPISHAGMNVPSQGESSDGGVEHSVTNSGYEWRIGRLRELGFECRLRSLVRDPHIEVQGRARAALELFGCDGGHPLDYDPAALLQYNSPPMMEAPRSPPVLPRVVESDGSSPASSS